MSFFLETVDVDDYGYIYIYIHTEILIIVQQWIFTVLLMVPPTIPMMVSESWVTIHPLEMPQVGTQNHVWPKS